MLSGKNIWHKEEWKDKVSTFIRVQIWESY